jgi:hypothetical protein
MEVMRWRQLEEAITDKTIRPRVREVVIHMTAFRAIRDQE